MPVSSHAPPSDRAATPLSVDHLLYLTDQNLRQGIELLFFAYRDFTSDPDAILLEMGLGRAHHRVLHFVGGNPGLTVAELLATLRIAKQSLARVLRPLQDQGLIAQRVGEKDRRQRRLHLTEAGAALEKRLQEAQRRRMRAAFQAAGPEAVAGFRRVLELMIDESERGRALSMIARS
ncbi:MarR family transcriptional regulator [Neomegalonema sp.]|uniref:MarR family winged helix-turn-helix transcriptional regulator n=1 Tax=Neomegalonema sp. TaxID=2039713 RepID=UPI002620FCAE|nr:MarR family transcriptional regulator [Neomegalonema sp.]MDD2867627.1 MarR family transcriptional regulator [Neomegalonema sp.]